MDALLDIVSVRVVREYADRPIGDESLQRMLEAGRATGSSKNRQEWRFYVTRKRDTLEQLARHVFEPTNVGRCQVTIGISTTAKSAYDAGRCAQNMILAAWAEGIGSVPNGVKDPDAARQLLGLPAEERLATLLSFGYPAHPHTPNPEDIGGILRRIKRKSLEELVVWAD